MVITRLHRMGQVDQRGVHSPLGHLAYRTLLVLIVVISLSTSAQTRPVANAHIEDGKITQSFQIKAVNVLSKGPFLPGDLIVFNVVSDLPKVKRQWIQVTADCLAYPAEWHQGTEDNFVIEEYVKKGQATAVISSGCLNGVHKVTEIILSDMDNNYTRVTSVELELPTFVVSKGHLLAGSSSRRLKKDSMRQLRIPSQIKLVKDKERSRILSLPRTTDGGQTLDWVATGECGIRRLTGASDLGGELWASDQGLCVLSVNTPWGSNLYQPLNQAATIEVFPSTAISCQPSSRKIVKFVVGSRCPKGYKRTK